MILKDTLTDEEFDTSNQEIQVLSSPAGFYISQLEPCGAPLSRLSDYYRTRSDAETALKEGWASRGAMENAELESELVASGKMTKSEIH